MHGLRDDALARVEEQPVRCDQAPDHGAGEGDQRQHAGAEVEEVPESITSDQHNHGYEQQSGSRRRTVGRSARCGERAVTTTRVHGGNSEQFGKAVPLPHSKWLQTERYEV
ncbi:hypothetical protein SAV14893_050360 [Streptomyces avermitilis]|uniref:Uncharacterized protein n=1 Tax=Streptomyces avermitilis TaxID=33903 RepID=A0A4D4M1N0_STRAX|nr:hypothetical protein SAVMC3_62660 [Streptomyces avermitilis]GDY65643.1 hypothetical protein SAV14893_050360 [Streptomyces avermitilis]GDY83205.1 hypothetical protein SAVCW2_24040 [Streptomyces avermitilis]